MHIQTPLVLHHGLSTSERRIWLKLDNLQPSGSFKLRGIGLLCTEAARMGKTEIVCPSGGNAGLAAAFAAAKLGMACHIFVPQSTPTATRARIAALGARVTVHGQVWDETNVLALEHAGAMHAAFVPAFDHPTLWRGHASLVDEILAEQPAIDTMITAVGGGGLLAGLMVGLERHNRHDIRLVGSETSGSASFAAAVAAGHPVTFTPNTVCSSLAASVVAAWPVENLARFRWQSAVLTDAQALMGAVRFADDLRMLVEPACGVSLALAYLDHPALADARNVAIIVCGGASTGTEMIQAWRRELN